MTLTAMRPDSGRSNGREIEPHPAGDLRLHEHRVHLRAAQPRARHLRARVRGAEKVRTSGPILLPLPGCAGKSPPGHSRTLLRAGPSPRAPRLRSDHPPSSTSSGSVSSSGVHRTGGSTPLSRQTVSIRRRAVALAMWRRFQVARNSTLCTAAIATCAASGAARRGTAPASTSRCANASASLGKASLASGASAASRAAAASGSPTPASSRTNCEITSSNLLEAVTTSPACPAAALQSLCHGPAVPSDS